MEDHASCTCSAVFRRIPDIALRSISPPREKSGNETAAPASVAVAFKIMERAVIPDVVFSEFFLRDPSL
jgi:hypothetical protein